MTNTIATHEQVNRLRLWVISLAVLLAGSLCLNLWSIVVGMRAHDAAVEARGAADAARYAAAKSREEAEEIKRMLAGIALDVGANHDWTEGQIEAVLREVEALRNGLKWPARRGR